MAGIGARNTFSEKIIHMKLFMQLYIRYLYLLDPLDSFFLIHQISFFRIKLLCMTNIDICTFSDAVTARKVSKYGVFSGPYFPVFGLNTDLKKTP